MAIPRHPDFTGFVIPGKQQEPQKVREGRATAGDATPENSGFLTPLGTSREDPHLRIPGFQGLPWQSRG